jgi:hypothetical protein
MGDMEKQKCYKIFLGKRPNFQAWKAIFKSDLNLVICRVKPVHEAPLAAGLDSL